MSNGHGDILARIGVVADTHVPDRAAGLHPALVPQLAAAGVQQILHAGDVCSPMVLRQLAEVAPVAAVRGNRDWLFRGKLPMVESVKIAGISILLLHGHLGFLPYIRDKWYYLREGYRLERYVRSFRAVARRAQVVVFGHTHRPETFWDQGQFFFNPGSASVNPRLGAQPSYGVIRIWADGSVEGEVLELTGSHLENRKWVPVVAPPA